VATEGAAIAPSGHVSGWRNPARLVIGSRTAIKASRSGALFGYLFGITVASSAIGYTTAYKTAEQREQFARLFASNGGLVALVGPGSQLQTVAGYTAWKSSMFLVILGAVWGLLTSTKLLRGEEDTGRWELYLAGQTTPRQAVSQVLAGLAGGLVTLWIVTSVVTVLVGHYHDVGIPTRDSLYFSLCLASGGAMFLGVGALTSQLSPTRRQAAGLAAVLLGISFALRMVADSSPDLEWLRWVSPIGWTEQLQPLTNPDPLALLPIAALTVLTAALAVHLAGTRDLGASVLPDRDTAPRARAPQSAGQLAFRLAWPTVLAWSVAIAATGLLMGFISPQGGTLLTSSETIRSVVERFGLRGAGAALYLGFTFLIVALLGGLVAAGQLSSTREEEASGRVEDLLVRSVSRWRWLGVRLGVTVAAVAVVTLFAAVFCWLGAASQSAGVSLTRLLEAGVNTIPPALCVLGLGALVLGVAPRLTNIATYGLVVWSFLIEIGGGFFSSNHWLLDTSLYHHLAYAPAVEPDWTSAGIMTLLAALACAGGLIGLRVRDLETERG
jgi:ABC-2 type transport system permease protein